MKRIRPLNMDVQKLKASEDIFQLNLKKSLRRTSRRDKH